MTNPETAHPNFDDRAMDYAAELLAKALGLGEGDSPFPWQVRLLRRLLRGELPRALDIPTGLGKTSTMAIWLVARALRAAVPTRLVYIVDRKVVVDQATRVAEDLREWVEANPVVKEGLGLDDRRLAVSTLRGQFVDNREWMDDPSQPAIVVGTVDMIGSRLLFEGYRASRRIRPYMAGLLGHDALFVLDEAHLVPPFERLLERVMVEPGDLASREAFGVTPPPSRLLSLSATGRSRGGELFELDDDDLAHPIVRKRLGAEKRLTFVDLAPKASLAEAAAAAAWALSEEGTQPIRCVVFLTRRDDAEAAKAHLEKLTGANKVKKGQAPPIETELLVGARRVHERALSAKRLEELGFVAGSNVPRERPHFLFATSAGEVGVDLDADHMVGDLVPWERMVQRLGRVNRRGEGRARVTILRAADLDDERLKGVEVLLRRLPAEGDAIDVSPGALRELARKAKSDGDLARGIRHASTPDLLYPPLEKPTIEAWSFTSLEEHPGRPAIAPWLRGWDEDRPQTALAWRALLPLENGQKPSEAVLQRFFRAAPIHTGEQLETETWRAAEWLKKRVKKVLTAQAKADANARKLEYAGVLRKRGGLELLTLEWIDARQKKHLEADLADADLILDARIAGLSGDGLLDAGVDVAPPCMDGEGWQLDAAFRVRITSSEEPTSEAGWRERERFPFEQTGDGEVVTWLVVDRPVGEYITEEDRSASGSQSLPEHAEWTAARMCEIARRLSLPPRVTQLLALAARLHDEGKRAERWQRAFNAPQNGEAYAKTRGPVNVALLEGYRHEFGSLAYAARDPEFAALSAPEQDLVLHLIASHHGFARPTISTSGCDDAPPSVLEARAREVALRFARLQASLGVWGLAWWEALLRAADQQASRELELRGAGGNGR